MREVSKFCPCNLIVRKWTQKRRFPRKEGTVGSKSHYQIARVKSLQSDSKNPCNLIVDFWAYTKVKAGIPLRMHGIDVSSSRACYWCRGLLMREVSKFCPCNLIVRILRQKRRSSWKEGTETPISHYQIARAENGNPCNLIVKILAIW